MKKSMSIVAIALLSSSAFAGFEARFITINGANNAIRVDNTGTGGTINQTYNAGHFVYEYTDVGGERGLGQFSGGTFATFCIELQQIEGGSQSYDIARIQDAPNPSPGLGGDYDASDEAAVNAVVAAAIRLSWINADLSLAGANNIQLAAIQGQIWKTLFADAVVTAEIASVGTAMAALQAEIANDPFATVPNLNAMVNPDSQDQLFIVPLPPAAFAGLLTLGGLVGVKRLRRS